MFGLYFHVVCLFSVISAHTVSQSHPSVLVQLGDSVTLKCTIEQEQLSQLLWYKQVVGQAPRAILSSSGYDSSLTLYKGFRDSRFVMQKNGTCFNLHISKVKFSDTATYYCGTIDFTELQLGNGTLLFVKDAETSYRSFHPPLSKSLQSKDNIDQQCVIYRQTQTGNQNVSCCEHLFGQADSRNTFIQGNVFQKSFEAGLPSQSSVYTLPKRNLRCSDAETYYSTVATCEEIISAKEIQLDNKVYHSYNSRQFPVVIALGVLNGVLIIMITVLTYRQFQSAKCGSFVESDSEDVAHSSSQHQDTDSTHHQNEESSLTYATLEVKHTVNGHRPKRRDVNMDTVYSEIEYREIMIHKC